MCFKFLSNDNDKLIEELSRTISLQYYFLFSKEDVNYLYIADSEVAKITMSIFKLENISLTHLSSAALKKEISDNGKNKFQTFYGSVILYNKFAEDN